MCTLYTQRVRAGIDGKDLAKKSRAVYRLKV